MSFSLFLYSDGDNPQLSKTDEKILRKIRRKIRNKRSAQCSRQRKKEYLEELEKKYSNCTNEVQNLKNEVQKLRREKISLISKIHKLMKSTDNQQELNLNEDDLNNNNNLGTNLTCGEHIQINKIEKQQLELEQIETSNLEQDLEQDLEGETNNNNLEIIKIDFKNENKIDKQSTNDSLVNLDDDLLDDEFTNYLLNSNNNDLQFDFENFEIKDLKDDGYLHYNYVNNFTNDNQLKIENNQLLVDYHQQAPVKTSLFLLVLCFVLMFVPFLR